MAFASTTIKAKKTDLLAEIVPSLMPVDNMQWRTLFQNHPDPPELIKLVDDSGMEGFEFYSIVIRKDQQPILIAPLMVARYPVATTLDGKAKEIGIWIETKIPNLLSPKVLLIGFVEGEWGQIGVTPNLNENLLNEAWLMLARSLEILRRKTGAEGMMFWQFTEEALAKIPNNLFDGFGFIASQPFSVLSIEFNSIEDYLSTLDSDMKRYLKRAWKNASRVRVVRTKNVEKYSDEIYEMYKEQVASSELSFGQQSRDYFRNVCKVVPAAEYTLYFDGENLLGWELLLKEPQHLSSKYFAMKKDAGREYKLYFLSWIENVHYCIKNGIKHFHVGASGEDLKTLLGAKLIPTAVVMKHSNPIIQAVLRSIEDDLAYESKIELPRIKLGWRN
jgi:hypothetical protein